MNETSADTQLPFAVPACRGAMTGLAALGAVFALPTAVDAAIVYSGIQNITATLATGQRRASNGTLGNTSVLTPLDLDGIGGTDFRLRARQLVTGGGFRFGMGALLPGPGNAVAGAEGGALNLRTSNSVGGQFPYNNGYLRSVRQFQGGKASGGYFANGVPGIVGVAFLEAGQTHFGWIKLQVDDGPQGFPYQVKAIEWAYESTANTAIHIENPVPEANPAMVLLAAGGTGLAAWRLRKRKQAAPSNAA